MATATLTSKGQITIPKNIRESLQLDTGDQIDFVLTDKGEAILKPVTKKVDEVFGKLYKPGRKPVSTNQMKAGIRQKIKKSFE